MSEINKAGLPHLTRLLLRTKRRMWLALVTRLLFRSFWWSGGFIFTAGMLHGLGAPLSWRYSLLLGLAPTIVAVAVGLFFRRPTLDQAAARLDAALGGKELMVSALAQARLPAHERAGAANFVLRQAEEAALIAGDRAEVQWWNPPAASGLVPLGLAVTGLMLHLNVGRAQFPLMEKLGFGATDRTVASTVSAVSASPILDLKRSLMQIASSSVSTEERRFEPHKERLPGPPRSLPSERASVNAIIQNPVEGARAPTGRVEGVDITGQENGAQTGLAPTGRSGRGSAAVGAAAPGSAEPGETPTVGISVEFLDIERRGRSGASNEGRVLSGVIPGSEFEKPTITQAQTSTERVEIPYESSFGPAMRAYVHSYFSQLHQRQ